MSTLLLHCHVVKKMWENLLGLVNLSWVFPKSVAPLINQWSAPHLGPNAEQLWKLSIHALLWVVWRVRNRRIFDNQNGDFHSIWDSFLFTFCCWAKSSRLFAIYSVDSFMSNLGALLLPQEIAP